MRTLIAVLMLAVAAHAVTDEEISAQRAVVVTEQTTLDSLVSLQAAEQLHAALITGDSLLTAYSVTIEQEPAPYDADGLYVSMDLTTAYAGLNAVQQALWDLMVSSLVYQPVSAGVYEVRVDRVPGYLDGFRYFISTYVEEAE